MTPQRLLAPLLIVVGLTALTNTAFGWARWAGELCAGTAIVVSAVTIVLVLRSKRTVQ